MWNMVHLSFNCCITLRVHKITCALPLHRAHDRHHSVAEHSTSYLSWLDTCLIWKLKWMYSSKDLNYWLNEPLHHCFMVFSILADDIKYFKYCAAIFGALNDGGIKNASQSRGEAALWGVFHIYVTGRQVHQIMSECSLNRRVSQTHWHRFK